MTNPLKESIEKFSVSMDREKIFNLPNCITMIRIGVVPILFLIVLGPGRVLSLIIAGLFIIAAITDFLDGYLARKYDIVTRMGKFLDPVADKLIVSTAMIMMIPAGRIPAWAVAIIIIRDILVDGLRSVAASNGVVMQASILGKQKTICQIIAVSALLIHYPLFGINAHVVGIVVLYFALFLTVWSCLDYFFRFYKSAFGE